MRRAPGSVALLPPLVLHLPQGPVTCLVVRSKGRRALLRINHNQRLELRVPRGANLAAAYEWARTRTSWAQQALGRVAARPRALTFTEGAAHQLRGQTVHLVLHAGTPRIWLHKDLLHVQLQEPGQSDAVQHTLAAYYRALASAELPQRMSELARSLPWRCASPTVRVRLMRARWGCCRHDGVITLSTLLLRAPAHCADYVAVHELCHLREFHHGPAFYGLLDKAMPGWRNARRDLETLPAWPGRAAEDFVAD